jgi:hypothetical protein
MVMLRHRKPPSQTWRTVLENHVKQKLRQAEAIQLVRLKRDNVNQNIQVWFAPAGLPRQPGWAIQARI